ncbi:MAG: GEVED domain-containing protein [Sedimentisphaerales bacterium]|nr:GEVED domain-containing protein [Sedimentisphaerales bacterium]
MNGYKFISVLAILLGISQIANGAPPANDGYQNAQAVGDVTSLAFDTTEATFDGPGECLSDATRNIWYCYTAACTGCATISLCGSNYDTKLAVYGECSSAPSLSNLLRCNDDFCGQQSELNLNVTAGNTYLIEIGGFGTSHGAGSLTISCNNAAGPPSNDTWSGAASIGNVSNLAFDTGCATFNGPGICITSSNLWFCYTPQNSCNITVSTAGSSFDTILAIYNGCNSSPNFGSLINCNDDGPGSRLAEISIPAIGGNTYLIEVGGYNGATGPGLISVNCDSIIPGDLSNNNCNNAMPIGDVTGLAFDTTNATFDGPGHCMNGPNIWYIYTAACTGNAAVSLCGSSYDTKLAVYEGGGCNPSLSRLIECNDDACDAQSEAAFEVVTGQQYLIEVGGFSDNTGPGLISISCEGTEPEEESDLGDAPDSTNNFGNNMTAYPKGGPSGVRAHYPTVFNDGSSSAPYGPIHLHPLAVAHLGKKVTHESEADIGSDQDVFNNIKPPSDSPDKDNGDDAVILPVNMPLCRWTTFDYIVNVINPGTDLWLNIWCDWNRDGDWDDDTLTDQALVCSNGIVSEWTVKNRFLFNLPAGLNQLTTPAFLSWHPDKGTEQIWMRVTLSGKPWTGGSAPGVRGNGGSGPQDGYDIGETEDYYFIPDTSFSICEDYDGDGVIDLQDLAAFTSQWLENCP